MRISRAPSSLIIIQKLLLDARTIQGLMRSIVGQTQNDSNAQASYDFCLVPRPENTFYDVESGPLWPGSKQVKFPLEERVL